MARLNTAIRNRKTVTCWMQAQSSRLARCTSISLTVGCNIQTNCLTMYGQVLIFFLEYYFFLNCFLNQSPFQADLRSWHYAKSTPAIALYGSFCMDVPVKFIAKSCSRALGAQPQRRKPALVTDDNEASLQPAPSNAKTIPFIWQANPIIGCRHSPGPSILISV